MSADSGTGLPSRAAFDLYTTFQFEAAAAAWVQEAEEASGAPSDTAVSLIAAADSFLAAHCGDAALAAAGRASAALDSEPDIAASEAAALRIQAELKKAEALRQLGRPLDALWRAREALLRFDDLPANGQHRPSADGIQLSSTRGEDDGKEKDGDEAFSVVFEQLRYLGRLEVSCALSEAFPHVSLVRVGPGGQIEAVAAQAVKHAGCLVVADERPVLCFDSSTAGSHPHRLPQPEDIVALAEQFEALPPVRRAAVLALPAPDSLPPKDAASLANAIQHVRRGGVEASGSVREMKISMLVKLAQLTHSPALREVAPSAPAASPNGDAPRRCVALFEVSGRVAHSCAPNVKVCGGGVSLISVRPIADGEPLGASRCSAQFLPCSADVRREYLRAAWRLDCKCSRCVGVDHCRGLPCELPCHGTRHRDGRTSKWMCSSCGESFADHELPLREEDALGERVSRLAARLRGSGVVKGIYEELKDLMTRAVPLVGRSTHWCYAEAAWLLSDYFGRLAQQMQGRPSEHDSAKMCFAWFRLWLDAARTQQLDVDCVDLVFARARAVALRCRATPELRGACRPVWDAAAIYDAAMSGGDGAPSAVVAESSLLQSRCSGEAKAAIAAGGPGAAVQTALAMLRKIPTYESDEEDVFKQWEDYLLQRVVDAQRGSQQRCVAPNVFGELKRFGAV